MDGWTRYLTYATRGRIWVEALLGFS